MTVDHVAKEGGPMMLDLSDEIVVWTLVMVVVGLMLVVLMFLDYWDLNQRLPR